MDHVPPPNPENYWKLTLDDPRVIMVNDSSGTLKPMLTLVVREIDEKAGKVSLQIVADPNMRMFFKQ